MEDQGLEANRLTIPASKGQSTNVNSDNPWRFRLRDEPKVTVEFNTAVSVKGLRLQANRKKNELYKIAYSIWDEEDKSFKRVVDSSGSTVVGEDKLYN